MTLATIPNLICVLRIALTVPIVLLLGVMRANDIPLSVGTVMVAVIAIGIAIEGTIHLFSRYSELCRRTSNYDEAVLETVKEEAAPVVATSLALALGFGVLLDRKSTRLNSSHMSESRMPSSA